MTEREVVALVKAELDSAAERPDVEEKLRAAEAWNNILLEKAERMDMSSYIQSKPESVPQRMPNSGLQLSLIFTNKCF